MIFLFFIGNKQTLVGDIDSAMRIILNYHQVLKQYGFTPEFYNIPNLEAVQKRGGYPLRPGINFGHYLQADRRQYFHG